MVISERREESEISCFQLNVSGKIIDFRLSDEYNLPRAYFHPSNKEYVFQAIHNYLLDFFGDTVEYAWRATYPENPIPHLPNLSLWFFYSTGRSGVRTMETLEKFFASSPIMKMICIRWSRPELISPESKFYQAESHYSRIKHSHNAHAFLKHFQGRQATLFFHEFNVLEFVEFINRWRSGEAFQKLEYLKIKLMSNFHHLIEVLNANGVKRIDRTKKPPIHTVPHLSQSIRVLQRNTDPIISHRYIVRETDNRVASVSVRGDMFCFGVWKETEEEFLRMVE
ncbi:hypothetical protein B9Z55_009161 [Caenorhabditis nigoni]|nr:hypothetical protein B9Z55_009161 [Caenorhabditis nigoni]